MTCATLILCLAPAIYVEQGAARMFAPARAPAGHAYVLDRTAHANPYSITEAGAEWSVHGRARVTLAVRHVSSVVTRADRGDNSAELRVRVYLRRQPQ